MKTPCHYLYRALLLVVICLPFKAIAAPGYSPNITVDTRGTGDVTVTGRVLEVVGTAKEPLGGATISVAGLNATSDANGAFTLANVDLATGATLTASATGFLAQTLTVVAGEEEKAVSVGDILLAAATDKPVVESLKPDVEGILLPGFGVINTVRARVNWNGSTPGTVQFRVNGNVFGTMLGAGPEYSISLPVDTALRASLGTTGNLISVTATAQEEGKVSDPSELIMVVVPLPAALQSGTKSTESLNLKVKFNFPATKPFGSVSLPVLGSLGGETAVTGEFSYDLLSSAWRLEAGKKFEGASDKYSAFKLKLGRMQDITAEIRGKANGTASMTKGIDLSSLEISSAFALNGRHRIGSFSPAGLLGSALRYFGLESVNKALSTVTFIIWLKPGLAGQSTFKAYPTFGFKDFTLSGKMGLEAAYEPKLGNIEAKLYVGGEPSVRFGLPGDFFQQARFKAYVGLSAKIFSFEMTPVEYVFVDVTYPAGASSFVSPSLRALGEGDQVLAAAQNASAKWRAMERPWRKKGGEVFLPEERVASVERPEATASPTISPSGLADFVRMGQVGGSSKPSLLGVVAPRVIQPDDQVPWEASFPLLSNVFPESEPGLAGKGEELMLAYVRDTGAANPVQFTEVAFSYFDGGAWTESAPIASDARGQFSPQVIFDGEGNAVVVFERIKDGTFAGAALSDMAALMEIVWSRWDAVTQTWSAPQALTNNAFLDFSPKLAGPLADGDLLLTWNESVSNQVDGTGIAGAATNLRVITCRWDSATQTWGTVSVLVPNLTGEVSQSLGAGANQGAYVWTVDMDGNTDDVTDTELYYRLYNATTGTWGPTVRHTTDAIADHHAKAVVDTVGNVYTVWNRNGDLVMGVNFTGPPGLVRSGEGTLGVADYALTVGPAGNLAVIWQEMTEHGSDAHYRVFDPLSGTWGKDVFLSQDADLERSFAPVWDAAGNLTLAYNNVQITKVTKEVEVEGGGIVAVDGVPEPGQVDLLVAKRALVIDLSAVPEGLTADGTTFLPGDVLTLTGRVRNSGNLAVENVEVAFYDGDPTTDGTLIGTATVPGWLEAAAEAELSLNWTVPEPAQARTIHMEVDPTFAVSEWDRGNNTLALPINGVDLALEYQSGSVLRDGSARVVVKVRNLSAPESPVVALRLKSEDGGVALAETVVRQLAPGQSLDVPFDLPAGTQPEGDRAYCLVIDEENSASDIDLENNEAPFVLTLWIDDDGDGIPRWWELTNGASDGSTTDASFDLDGDGFDTLAEFLSGTDPRNGQSRLGIGQFHTITSTQTGGMTSTISWASATGRLYRVERSFDLNIWHTVADDVEPVPPLNTFTDTIVPPGGRVFYRVGVK